MNKSYIWKQKDTITAQRLNTMSCAVNCLIDALPAQLSCKSRAQNQTINQGDMQEQIPPQKYRHDTSLYWRHPHLG